MNRTTEPSKTWFVDIDGVIFPHNGHLQLSNTEFEKPLPGVVEFFKSLNNQDIVILCTARKELYRNQTELSLKNAGIKYNLLIMGLSSGGRILINDQKPDGKKTAYAINIVRNEGLKFIEMPE